MTAGQTADQPALTQAERPGASAERGLVLLARLASLSPAKRALFAKRLAGRLESSDSAVPVAGAAALRGEVRDLGDRNDERDH